MQVLTCSILFAISSVAFASDTSEANPGGDEAGNEHVGTTVKDKTIPHRAVRMVRSGLASRRLGPQKTTRLKLL